MLCHFLRDLSQETEKFVERSKIIAICRGKREKSLFVAENGKNRGPAQKVINFCP